MQLVTFGAPELARTIRPGQFALARDATTHDPYLRRTLWFYSIDGGRVAFTLSAHDPIASRARNGDIIDLLAPMGHAIEFGTNVRRVLFIGEGTQTVKLIAAAHDAIAHHREVVLACVNPNNFPIHLLSPEVEFRSEESLNAELITWADAIIASGSSELYQTLADKIRTTRYLLEPGFARVFIDMPMPCGTGECGACSVDTARGVRFACVDGPVFDLAISKIGERGESFP